MVRRDPARRRRTVPRGGGDCPESRDTRTPDVRTDGGAGGGRTDGSDRPDRNAWRDGMAWTYRARRTARRDRRVGADGVGLKRVRTQARAGGTRLRTPGTQGSGNPGRNVWASPGRKGSGGRDEQLRQPGTRLGRRGGARRVCGGPTDRAEPSGPGGEGVVGWRASAVGARAVPAGAVASGADGHVDGEDRGAGEDQGDPGHEVGKDWRTAVAGSRPVKRVRVLIALRISNETDASTSLERQLHDCRQHIMERAHLGWEEVGVAKDAHISATKTPPLKRPDLGEWLRGRVTTCTRP